MAYYRKKPVVIQAAVFPGLQDLGTILGMEKVMEFEDELEAMFGFKLMGDNTFKYKNGKLLIKTLEGVMEASAGDYIIKGVAGEAYPCKPDIFERTYEPVNENPE